MKCAIQLSLFPELVPPVVYKFRVRSKGNKLTKNQIQEIRQKLLSGNCSQVTLAKQYGVTQPAISKIKNYVTWD